MSKVLHVPGLKKNLLYIYTMEDRGYAMEFIDGKVLSWPKSLIHYSTKVIGTHDGSHYKLIGHPIQALVHDNDNPFKIWNRILGHLHHQSLPLLRKMVIGLPKFETKHQGVCRGCALGKNVEDQSSDSRSKRILDLVHSDVSGPMPVPIWVVTNIM
jgi:hypothetical protein